MAELQAERQAVRKLDYSILPFITLFYLLSFLDRANIGEKHSVAPTHTELKTQIAGNARVAGLQKDLHLTDKQFQMCMSVFFGPYIVAELPASLLLRKIGARILLPTLVITWGVVATFQGFVKSYAGLMTVRVFLGFCEGPMAPAMIVYLSGFYTRKELSLRIALIASAVALSGAFSGMLAAAIENMNGLGGRPGWAWIFFLEGLFSILIGLLGLLFIPSTPDDAKLLTENQKHLIMKRLEGDRPFIKLVDRLSFKEVLRSVSSPHVIILVIIYFMGGTQLYGLAFFLPSIVNELGFSSNKTQLLSVGPFVVGCFVTLISAFCSDRYESRGITIALTTLLSVVGFAIFLGAEHKSTIYGALYLMVAGVYGTFPVISAWMANNSEPFYRRAASVALGFILANLGGVLSTQSFPTNEGPKYRKTTIMNLIFSILAVVGALVNVAYLTWKNKVKKRPEVRARLLEKYAAAIKEGCDDGGLSAWIELGDRHPDFVYTT